MKKLFQLILIILLILISIFSYNKYFKKDKIQIKSTSNNLSNSIENEKSNLIKNLKYQVKFDNNTQYYVTADLSELTYENNKEIVKMQIVTGIFTNQKQIPLTIKASSAIYNNFNYNTNFSDNVIIKYKDNTIRSENLNLDFEKNIIKIYNNVVYEGVNGLIKTDNVKINLLTKDVDIFMNNPDNNINIKSK